MKNNGIILGETCFINSRKGSVVVVLHVSKTKHYLQCSLTQHYQILPAIERQAFLLRFR